MARAVNGRITDRQGNPAVGLKVEAWDSDWPDADERMGVTTTDPDGNYELHYREGHWDPWPHNITKWRPDIYVTVSMVNRVENWVAIGKSRTYEDHKLADDLRVDMSVDIAPVLKNRTNFNVAKYAFKFPNNFVVSDFLNIPGAWHMGFCGGMSSGALHRYGHGCAVPTQTATPVEGTALFTELKQRQWDTLPAAVIAKIYDWQRSPDDPHMHTPHSIRYRQKDEWPVLQQHIDAGKPAVLVLIREEGYLADLTKNHQVLAIGYEYNPTTRDLTVEVYDPNDSGGSNFLYLCMAGGELRAEQKNSKDDTKRFRGFFVDPAGTDASSKHYK